MLHAVRSAITATHELLVANNYWVE